MNKNILIIIFLFLGFKSLSQNQIYTKNKSYPSTNEWTFYINNSLPSSVNISIGKENNKGVILLSVPSYGRGNYIKGELYLFLENGKRIKCYDRNIKDFVNDKSLALYYLVPKEIELLKMYRILQVRFKIKEGIYSGNKSYSATNGNGFTKIIKTEKEISNLFY